MLVELAMLMAGQAAPPPPTVPPPTAPPSVRVETAIIRAGDAAGTDVAAYAAFVAPAGDRLVGLSCACAERVEIHRVVRREGAASMTAEAGLALPAGARVAVRPGSDLHFMLMNIRAPIAPGQRHVLTLRFAAAGAIEVPFETVADSATGWARASLAPDLRPLAPLVGSCWRATFPNSTQTNTHCYSVMPGGRQVRDRHRVDGGTGPYGGETIYRWDAAARGIRYDYFASDGGYSGGSAVQVEGGLSFPDETYVGANGRSLTLRNGATWDGENHDVATSAMRQGDGWREMWRMRFERIGPAPGE